MVPDERKFVVLPRGVNRDDVILAYYRNALRQLTNPDTGAVFTEDEIALATQPGSRFYIEADAIDLVCQGSQQRALWFAEQVRPDRAGTGFLEAYHGRMWLGEDSRLPATGASGTVAAPATSGSVFPGSATVPDPTDTAAVAVDANGYSYQVLANVTTPAGGTAYLQMQAIDTGVETNLDVGAVLTWSKNQPVGAQPTASVYGVALSGGFGIETDDEYAMRILERIRHRAASGNSAHFVAWAKQASNAIESAYVYPCIFHAGGLIVSPLSKRGTKTGPTARTTIDPGNLITVREYLTPPNSPVVPDRAFVVVVPPNPQTSNIVLKIGMGRSPSGGWYDAFPWPSYSLLYPEVKISAVNSVTDFDVLTDAELPGSATSLSGSDAPQLMLWDEVNSRWELLAVDTVDATSSPTVNITLNTEPNCALATNQVISPYTDRLDMIAESVESYFDSLGPGEMVDLDTDDRAHRAKRYPRPSAIRPATAGQMMLLRVLDALGDIVYDAELSDISRIEADLPGDVMDGPNMIVLGRLSAFSL